MASLSNLSARHQELINAIIKNLGNADIDWDAVAADANFSSAKYAKDEYRKARKVLGAGDANGAAPTTPAKKKASPKKRKNDEDKDDNELKSIKKTKKNGKGGGKEKGEGESTGLIKPEPESDDGELV